MRIPITINGREGPVSHENEEWIEERSPFSAPAGYACAPTPEENGGEAGAEGTETSPPAQPPEGAEQKRPQSRKRRRSHREQQGLNGEAEAKAEPAPPEEGEPDWKDRYVRLLADFENYKRHAEARETRLVQTGKEAVLEDLLPFVEHMERALEAARGAEDRSGIVEGIELVYRELLRLLEKHGVERIGTVGHPFDPEVHEAVAVRPHPDYPEDTVIEEIRAGFRRDGKLLRPASVVVSR